MSTRRISADAGWFNTPKERGPSGRGLCRRCSQEVPKGRRTFCSPECVHEHRLRTDPGYVRLRVFERDKGVCAKCNKDTMQDRPPGLRQIERRSGHLWQADHILPVVEGGGECGLDNLRTLCTECHKQETAELRRRMAQRRVASRLLPIFQGTEISHQEIQ